MPLLLLLWSIEGTLILLRFADAALQKESDTGSADLVLNTYSVGAIFRPLEVYHAVETSERRTVTLVAVRVQFLLREDVSAALHRR